MVRISAIFIAVCMVLIAASVGFVVYLRFGMTGAESFLIGLGVLTALTVADLTRGTGRFNLAQGLVGTISGAGASLSTTLSGLLAGMIRAPVRSGIERAP